MRLDVNTILEILITLVKPNITVDIKLIGRLK